LPLAGLQYPKEMSVPPIQQVNAIWNNSVKAILDRAAFCVTVTLQSLNVILSIALELYTVKSDFGIVSLAVAASAPTLTAFWLIPMVLPLAFRRTLSSILAAIFTCYSVLSFILVVYRLQRRFTLDFRFLWYNLGDTYRTFEALTGHMHLLGIGLVVLLWLHYRCMRRVFAKAAYAERAWPAGYGLGDGALFSLAGVILLATVHIYVNNEFERFVSQAVVSPSDLVLTYTNGFADSLRTNKANKVISASHASQRNLFWVQLESINAHLVNRQITPQLLGIAERYGILVPKIQSSSVMTVRAQETLLCSVLPSLRESIAQSEQAASGLVCLPAILRMQGFRTMYFQSYPDLSFGEIDRFFKTLGFDELHSADIMKPEDALLPWGYADDLFYQRVFEYLERNHVGERIFVYIAVSSTNHFPFGYDPKKYEAKNNGRYSLPFRTPKDLKEQIANTTYLQDQFFGSMFSEFYLKKFASNSTLLVFGDHSWPVGIHEGNEFNENLAFQENFVSSLAIIPPGLDRQSYSLGKTVTTLHSHLDILPTVLDMYGIQNLRYYGKSFLAETKNRAEPSQQRCVPSVQPFSGGYIAVINYPLKNIFNVRDNSVTTYDLDRDPNEGSPISRQKVDDAALGLLNRCLLSLSR
jgi:hypothetical protein